jgi:Neuraminidase-like domain
MPSSPIKEQIPPIPRPPVPPAGGPTPITLSGHLIFDTGLPADAVTLRAYQHTFGGAPTHLADATTDVNGHYTLTYTPATGPVYLEIRAVDAKGAEVRISDTSYDAVPSSPLNLVVPSSLRPLAPEYTRLIGDLAKQVGTIDKLGAAVENDDRQDLTLLSAATNWDGRIVAVAATAQQASTDTGMSADSLYALFRLGFPTDRQQLAFVSPDTVEQGIKIAKASGVVDVDDAHVASAKAAFSAFAAKTLATVKTPGATSSYADLAAKVPSLGNAAPVFLQAYFAHEGDSAGLWKAAQAAGVDAPTVAALQLQGKLSHLTLNSAAVVDVLQKDLGAGGDPSKLVAADLHDPAAWKTKLTAVAGNDDKALAALIPPLYDQTDTPSRLDAYASDLARRVRMAFPSQVVARKVETGAIKVGAGIPNAPAALQANVTTVLNAAKAASPTFELGHTPLNTFLAQNGTTITTAIKPEERDATVAAVKQLHRLYQITPTDESLNVLLAQGFTSAREIAQLPEDTFVTRYGALFPSREEATLVHRKSQQVAQTTFSIFATAKQLDTAVPLLGVSPTGARAAERDTAKANVIKQYPSLETLFGSLDFCACEDCQSVLSPAAYFVDLLQFIDPPATHWSGFLEQWKTDHAQLPYPFSDQASLDQWRKDNPGKPDTAAAKTPYEVLTARRPDLPNIGLTCENTNTAMPYIDIATEILEYFVAHDALQADAAHDTGKAATEDLLAEPQNVLPAAYDKLKAAAFPLGLPFDPWTDATRALLQRFGTSRAELLERLRTGDALFAPNAQSYALADVLFERLGFAPCEIRLLTDPNTLASWWMLYGYKDATAALGELTSAKTLSRKLGLTYAEVVALVESTFVNPNLASLAILRRLGLDARDVQRYESDPTFPADERAAFEKKLADLTAQFPGSGFDAKAWLNGAWNDKKFSRVVVLRDPDAGCSFDKTTVTYLDTAADGPVFLKMNVLVRIWRKLGWTLAETDAALTAFVRGWDGQSLDKLAGPLQTALVYVADLEEVHSRSHAAAGSRAALVGLWSDLSTSGSASLYEKTFLASSVESDDATFDDPVGNYLSKAGEVIGQHLPALQAALGVSATEVEAIAADAGQTLTTWPLTLASVSLVYRYVLLARVAGLSIADLLSLKALSGLDPLGPLAAGPLAASSDDAPRAQTLRFLDIASQVRGGGFTAPALDYLLRHKYDPVGPYADNTASRLAFVRTLAVGLRQVLADQNAPTDPAQITDDRLQRELALVLPADAVQTVMGLWTGTAPTQATRAKTLPADKLDPAAFAKTPWITVAYDAVLEAQSVGVQGVLSDALRAQLQTAVPSPVLSDLLGSVQAIQRAFFDGTLSFLFAARADYESLFAPFDPTLKPDALQAEVVRRRAALLALILPAARQRQIRALVAQQLSSALSADPGLTLALLMNQALLANPAQPTAPLLDAFTAVQEPGVTVTFFASTDATGPSLGSFTTLDCDTAASTRPAGANSARFDAYFEVPASGPYRLFAQLDKKDATAELRVAGLPDPVAQGAAAADGAELSGVAELTAGTIYAIGFTARNLGGGEARLRVQGESWPKSRVASLPLYAADAVDQALRGYTLLAKTTQIVTTLALTEREVTYFGTHAGDFAGLSFAKLPTRAVDDTPAAAVALFLPLLRLMAYAALRKDMAGGRDGLVDVFALAQRTYPASTAPASVQPQMFADVCAALAVLTRRNADAVQSAATRLGLTPMVTQTAQSLQITVPGLAQEVGTGALWGLLQWLHRVGVSVDEAARWAVSEPDATVVARIKAAVKSQVGLDGWRTVAPSIFDPLRQHRRDALVVYLTDHLGLEQPGQLFEYFLVDPGMEPVVQASRISLAIASVQTFVQRCFMDLEPEVRASALDAERWKVQKSSATAIAAKKIFVWTSNYLEPEYRDDITEPCRKAASKLLQGNGTPELTEAVYHEYLLSLRDLARLEVVSAFSEYDRESSAAPTLHVLARSPAHPRRYYYRQYATGMWTPWETVGAKIQGDHAIVLVWQSRTYVFWLSFLLKGDMSQSTGPAQKFNDMAAAEVPATAMKVQIELSWSERTRGAWSPGSSTGFQDALEFPADADFDVSQVFIDAALGVEGGIEVATIYVHMPRVDSGSFKLRTSAAGPKPQPTAPSRSLPPPNAPLKDPTPSGSLLGGGDDGTGFTVEYVASTRNGANEPPVPQPVLTTGSAFAIAPCSTVNTVGANDADRLVMPFFYRDEGAQFFVQPTLTETTFVEWDDWAVRPSNPVPWYGTAANLKSIPLAAAVPLYTPEIAASAGSTWDGTVHPSAVYSIAPPRDWVTSPSSVVTYGTALVGSRGSLGLAVVTAATASNQSRTVAVARGSAVPSGSVVVQTSKGLAAQQVIRGGATLHVIGTTGLTPSLISKLAIARTAGT